jgi:hypothetical protein
MAITNDSVIADTWKHAANTSRLISLGFYDGTTSGLIELEPGAVFRYDVVAWDSGQDQRVYCLARMPARAFADLIELLSPSEAPRWPQWFPRWEFSSEGQQSVEKILDQAGPYSVAGLGTDITAIDVALPLEGQAWERAQELRRTGKLQHFHDWLPLFHANQ